jgi:hypothetical protein
MRMNTRECTGLTMKVESLVFPTVFKQVADCGQVMFEEPAAASGAREASQHAGIGQHPGQLKPLGQRSSGANGRADKIESFDAPREKRLVVV